MSWTNSQQLPQNFLAILLAINCRNLYVFGDIFWKVKRGIFTDVACIEDVKICGQVLLQIQGIRCIHGVD